MDLLERYLGVVRSALTAREADDILKELSANLRAEMEDRERERGRPLEDADVEAILRRHGHPLLVAGRYRTGHGSLAFGRQWIGPEVFPLYARVLSIALGIAAPATIVAILVFGNGRPAGAMVFDILTTIAFQFGVVTAIFIAANRSLTRHPDLWDALTFGPPRDRVKRTGLDALAFHVLGRPYREIPRLLSVFDLAMAAVALLWWRAMPAPDAAGALRGGPAWDAFYLPGALLVAIGAVQPAVNLIRPRLARFRPWMRAGIHAAFAVLFTASLRAGSWVLLADPASASERQRQFVATLDQWIGVSVACVVPVLVVLALLELRRATGSEIDARPEPAPAGVAVLP